MESGGAPDVGPRRNTSQTSQTGAKPGGGGATLNRSVESAVESGRDRHQEEAKQVWSAVMEPAAPLEATTEMAWEEAGSERNAPRREERNLKLSTIIHSRFS